MQKNTERQGWRAAWHGRLGDSTLLKDAGGSTGSFGKRPATRSQNPELFQLYSQGDHPPRLPKLSIEPVPTKGKPNEFTKLK